MRPFGFLESRVIFNFESKNPFIMVFNKNITNSGLSVFELIVIVALITVALSIIKVSATDLRAKHRDSVRISHIRELSQALGVYYEQNKKYPVVPQKTAVSGVDDLSVAL